MKLDINTHQITNLFKHKPTQKNKEHQIKHGSTQYNKEHEHEQVCMK